MPNGKNYIIPLINHNNISKNNNTSINNYFVLFNTFLQNNK